MQHDCFSTWLCSITLIIIHSMILQSYITWSCQVISAWQSADGRVTSDHCRVTVQRLFSKIFRIAWNVQKTLFDSRPTVAWPRTIVAWPFSDFFRNFSELLETSKKCCLTVSQRSRELRPLSRNRSATFFKNSPNCLKRSKKRFFTVGRRSRDLRPLSRDRSVTFFKISPNCLKRRKNVV